MFQLPMHLEQVFELVQNNSIIFKFISFINTVLFYSKSFSNEWQFTYWRNQFPVEEEINTNQKLTGHWNCQKRILREGNESSRKRTIKVMAFFKTKSENLTWTFQCRCQSRVGELENQLQSFKKEKSSLFHHKFSTEKTIKVLESKLELLEKDVSPSDQL